MSFRQRHRIVDLGVGVGARPKHYPDIFAGCPAVDWFEIISENFMVEGGPPMANLERLTQAHRVVPHGVSLSIGSTDPLNREYLGRLKALVARVRPPWASDHLCWTGAGGIDMHDLLPLPYTEEAALHVAARIRRVQDFLEVPFAIENVSSYMTYRTSTMPEWEFLSLVADRADCGILLDCNNIFVSAFNHGFRAEEYVDEIDPSRVVQIHLAGHTDRGKYLLDTHSAPVAGGVWELYRRALRRIGPTSTLIEWDEDIPAFETVVREATLARAVRQEVFGQSAAPEARA